MAFQLLPKLVTLNGLERQIAIILSHFTEIGSFAELLRHSKTHTACGMT